MSNFKYFQLLIVCWPCIASYYKHITRSFFSYVSGPQNCGRISVHAYQFLFFYTEFDVQLVQVVFCNMFLLPLMVFELNYISKTCTGGSPCLLIAIIWCCPQHKPLFVSRILNFVIWKYLYLTESVIWIINTFVEQYWDIYDLSVSLITVVLLQS